MIYPHDSGIAIILFVSSHVFIFPVIHRLNKNCPSDLAISNMIKKSEAWDDDNHGRITINLSMKEGFL